MKRIKNWMYAWILSWLGYATRSIPEVVASRIRWVGMLPVLLDTHYARYARASGFKETW